MKRLISRRLTDRTARLVITLGGLFIIASILAILIFLVGETLPLWKSASVIPDAPCRPAGTDADHRPAIILGANEYREIVFAVSSDGRARIHRVADGTELFAERLAALGGSGVSVAAPLEPGARDWVAATRDGNLVRITLEDGIKYSASGRTYSPRVVAGEPIAIAPGRAIRLLGVRAHEDGFTAAVLIDGGELTVGRLREQRSLLGEKKQELESWPVPLAAETRPTVLALDDEARHLFVGTQSGRILEWEVRKESRLPIGSYQVFMGGGVKSLGILLGGHSVVAGGESGEVEVWFRARAGEDGGIRFIRAHTFPSHGASVAGVAVSNRNKGFLTWDTTGEARLHYSTTASTRLRFDTGVPNSDAMVLTPKSDGVLAAGHNGEILRWRLENPHPEVTLGALFRKVHYEGFAEPEYVWQSTGGTDEFEPKLSLMPLIYGTLKGTVYALVFSLPVAIFAALYTALFMAPRLRNYVKPAMEMMAALPSVVLGLLGGLWLAPRLQSLMPAFLVLPLMLFGAVALFGYGLARVGWWRQKGLHNGTQPVVLLPVLAIGAFLCFGLNSPMNQLFDGDVFRWLYETFGARYDQRNAIVVGAAMGLAVIPIIFSISEDAISSVPRHLVAGSLAVGATPWQTAWRIVLPAASPGIFSAVMIGFGRAVGETMIVLMATGNTPIMDWNPFNGFRTLSANIAVEIPEAPHGGSLYRLLFLTALLLFMITFAVNTAAELIRHRLRARYSRF